ncbi:MAG: hypothetical protein DME17_21620 [Candidatus Rokuibacteriota bacterium]|nr:MAG: hypothetical protein DME17_21620 [Candidatus Rokubacteria bacterium]
MGPRMGLTVYYTKGIVAPVDGFQLRRLRTRAGLTQAALAATLGVAPNTVARWERNERTITEPMTRLIRVTVEASNRKRKGD